MSDLNLSQLNIEDGYKTYEGPSPVHKFFIPCLENSIRYDRAAGFFTSGALAKLTTGLEAFRKNNGKMRLITSPRLTEEDVQQIEDGYNLRDRIHEIVEDNFKELGIKSPEQLGYLGKLVAEGILDIRIAFFKDQRSAMFHEKWGIFEDKGGNSCYFIGSNNETVYAQEHNAESFDITTSWETELAERKISKKKDDFNRLWESRISKLEVSELSQVSREILAKYAEQVPKDFVPLIDTEQERVIQVESFSLRPYQQNAIDAWLANGGRGVLKMATGTGKTVTAIGAINQLLKSDESIEPLLILITCPLKNLVEQWDRAMRIEPYKKILCYENRNHWYDSAQRVCNELRDLNSGVGVFITTHSTWSRGDLKGLISRWTGKLLVISDEVHHMGSRKRRSSLPKNATFTLGLSATPERHNDPVGTQEILNYFGDVVYELSIKKAIGLGCLSPYSYRPIRVYLSEEELDEYTKLSGRIAALLAQNGGVLDDDDDDFEEYMTKVRLRNALLGGCESKLEAFRDQAETRKDADYQLVFCSEGKGFNKEKQLDEVLLLLGHDLELSARKYIAETSSEERIRILKEFQKQQLKFVVSMKCLDEGVDLPDARIAYILASSTDPRQWVQRRGRILRLPSNNDLKLAEIIDFVTLPRPNSSLSEAVKRLIDNEIKRIIEFGSDSVNSLDALEFVKSLETDFNMGES